MTDYTDKIIGDRYRIVKQLGEGGMAIVFKAFDTRLERYVAIKIIRKEKFPAEEWKRVSARFVREAKTLASIQHQNIVTVYDYGNTDDLPFIVMELVKGGTLKQRMVRIFSPAEAAAILAPIADGLDYAHRKGILHRDVTPSNIMFRQEGNPVITDFGIAKIQDNSNEQPLTKTGFTLGTPEYESPEQGMLKEIDGRADEYSLGIIFYEMLTGKQPFKGETPVETLFKQQLDPLPEPENIPENVREILYKALEKDPANRYPTIGAFGTELKKLINNPEQNPDVEINLDGSTASVEVKPLADPIPELAISPSEELPPETAPEKKKTRLKYLLWMILFLASVGAGIFVILRKDLLSIFPKAAATEEINPFAETITDTPAITGTITFTPGITETMTNTPAITETMTPTPGITESMTYTPDKIYEGQIIGSCPYPTFQEVGSVTHIAPGFTLGIKLRYSPAGEETGYQAVREKYDGSLYDIQIIDGPECVKKIVWYYVSWNGYKGWIAETDINGSDKYYLEKYEGSDVQSGIIPTIE